MAATSTPTTNAFTPNEELEISEAIDTAEGLVQAPPEMERKAKGLSAEEARELKRQGKTVIVYPAKSKDGKEVRHPMSGSTYEVAPDGSHRLKHKKPKMSKKQRRKWRKEMLALDTDSFVDILPYAVERGWKIPPTNHLDEGLMRAWVRYWQGMARFESNPDAGRPIPPHRSGGGQKL